MSFFKSIAVIIFSKLADLEFLLNEHSSFKKQKFRNFHFKLLGVRHKSNFRAGVELYIKNGKNLFLGDRCSIGSFTKIWNYDSVKIGDDFLSAGCLTINTGGHNPKTLESFSKPIIIGSRVWCGVNVTILSGVTIGNDVIIGAGSVVVKDIPDFTIVAGVPAKPIKTIERDSEIHTQHNWSN